MVRSNRIQEFAVLDVQKAIRENKNMGRAIQPMVLVKKRLLNTCAFFVFAYIFMAFMFWGWGECVGVYSHSRPGVLNIILIVKTSRDFR